MAGAVERDLADRVGADPHAGDGGDILGGQLSGPLRRRDDLGVVLPEPAPGLVQVEPEVVPATKRRGPAPSLDPCGPFGRDALRDVRSHDGLGRGCYGQRLVEDPKEGERLGELEVERALARSRIPPEAVEDLGAEVLDVRALVAQQCLAQAASVGSTDTVAPLSEGFEDPLCDSLDRVDAEHTLRQPLSLEVAEGEDLPEPPVEVADSSDLQAHALGHARLVAAAKGSRVATQHVEPLLVVPGPEGGSRVQALAQQDGHGRASVRWLGADDVEGISERREEPLQRMVLRHAS